MDRNSIPVCPELRSFSDCVDVTETGHEQLHKHGRLSLFESRVLPSGKGRIAFVGGSVSALSFHPWARGICALAAHRSEQPVHRILKCYSGSGHIQLWKFSQNDTRCLGVIEHDGDCIWDLKWRPEQSHRDGSDGWEGTLAAALGDGTVLVSKIDSFSNSNHRLEKEAVKTLYPTSTQLRVNKNIANRSPVRVVEWSKDGNLLVIGAADGSIEVYDATSVDRTWPKWSIPGHESVVVDLRWLSETHLCSLGMSCVLRLRDIRDPVSTVEQNMEGLNGSMSMDALEPNVAIIGGDYGYLRVVRLSGVDGMLPQKSVKRVRLQSGSFRDMCSIPISGDDDKLCSQTLFYTGGADGMLHECRFPRPLWTSPKECGIGKTQIGERLRWTQTTEVKEGGEEVRTLHLQLRKSLAAGGIELGQGAVLSTENRSMGNVSADTQLQETSTSSASRKAKRKQTVGRGGMADAYSRFGSEYNELAGVTRTSLSAPSDVLAVGISGGIVTWMPLLLGAHKIDACFRYSFEHGTAPNSATKPPRKRGRPRGIPIVPMQLPGSSGADGREMTSTIRTPGTAESRHPIASIPPEKASPTSTTRIPTPPASYSTEAPAQGAVPQGKRSPAKSSSPTPKRDNLRIAPPPPEQRRNQRRMKKGEDEADRKSSDSINNSRAGQSPCLPDDGFAIDEEIRVMDETSNGTHVLKDIKDARIGDNPEGGDFGHVMDAKGNSIKEKRGELRRSNKLQHTPRDSDLSSPETSGPAELKKVSENAEGQIELAATKAKEIVGDHTTFVYANGESGLPKTTSRKVTKEKTSGKRVQAGQKTPSAGTRRSLRTRSANSREPPSNGGIRVDTILPPKDNPSENTARDGQALEDPPTSREGVEGQAVMTTNRREEDEKAGNPKSAVANSNRARGRVKVAKIGVPANNRAPSRSSAARTQGADSSSRGDDGGNAASGMQVAHSSPRQHAMLWPDVGKMTPPAIAEQNAAAAVSKGAKEELEPIQESPDKKDRYEQCDKSEKTAAAKPETKGIAQEDGKLPSTNAAPTTPSPLPCEGDNTACVLEVRAASPSLKSEQASPPASPSKRQRKDQLADGGIQEDSGVRTHCPCRVRIRAERTTQRVRLRVRAPDAEMPRRSTRTRTLRMSLDQGPRSQSRSSSPSPSRRATRLSKTRSVKVRLRIAEPVALTDSEGEGEPVRLVPVRLRVRLGRLGGGASVEDEVGSGGGSAKRARETEPDVPDEASGTRMKRVRRPSWKLA